MLKLDGKAYTVAATTIGTAGLVQGTGTLSGTVADAGTIDTNGGLLKLPGAVSGSGKLLIENGATLQLGAGSPTGLTFASGTVARRGWISKQRSRAESADWLWAMGTISWLRQ